MALPFHIQVHLSLYQSDARLKNPQDTFSDYIKFGYKTELTRDELETYREYGGAPWLDGHTAVFGQAYDGLDVLDAVIAAHSEDESVQIIIDGIETN